MSNEKKLSAYRIKNVSNGQYMRVPGGSFIDERIKCAGGGPGVPPMEFIKNGEDSDCNFRYTRANLYLSFVNISPSPVKLYDSDEDARYRLDPVKGQPNTFNIYDISYGQYMFLHGPDEPRVQGGQDPSDPRTQWVIEPVEVTEKPVWAIGHMCNELKYVGESLAAGGNAIECDLEVTNPTETKKPYTVQVHHSGIAPAYPPNGGGTTPLTDYLKGLASDYMSKLAGGVVFDIKEIEGVDYKKYGTELGNAIIDAGLPPERCVLSCATTKMVALFDGIPATAAFNRDISMIDINPGGKPPQLWLETAEKYGCNWLGMGVSAYLPGSPLRNWLAPLAYAAAHKGTKNIVKKVYYWTLDSENSMRKALDMGIDGVICNIQSTPKDLYTGLPGMPNIVSQDYGLRMATTADSLD